MAQLPVYRQQGNITTNPPGQVRDLDTYSQGYSAMQKNANALLALSAQWQESKDAVENLDGRNKLNSGISAILDEAANYNDYSTPEDLSKKQEELTQRMNNLVPDIVSGFSNNQKAREFESNGQFTTEQNIYKLQSIFRDKYGDMYNANLQQTADSSLRDFTKTGNEVYKQEYFNAIDTGVNAGYLNREQAEKLKLGTNEWNYNYVYSQILEDPYFKASDEVMEKIDPVKQRTLRNFQRTEIKRAQAEEYQSATNDYFLNPTPANLRRVRKHNPNFHDPNADTPPNYNRVTTYEGMSDALAAVKDLANMDVSTPEGKRAYAKKASEVGFAIKNMQVKSKDNKVGISANDQQKLFNMIYKDMMNDNFKNKLKNMPDLSKVNYSEYYKEHSLLQSRYLKAEQDYIKLKSKTPSNMLNSPELKKAKEKKDQAWKNYHYYENAYDKLNQNRQKNAPITVGLRMEQLQRDASKAMLEAYMTGDVNTANKIKEQFGNDMVRLKYWNIPELQRKNLKQGDKFTINGKVYSYQGFSKNDVIVEVK